MTDFQAQLDALPSLIASHVHLKLLNMEQQKLNQQNPLSMFQQRQQNYTQNPSQHHHNFFQQQKYPSLFKNQQGFKTPRQILKKDLQENYNKEHVVPNKNSLLSTQNNAEAKAQSHTQTFSKKNDNTSDYANTLQPKKASIIQLSNPAHQSITQSLPANKLTNSTPSSDNIIATGFFSAASITLTNATTNF